MKVIIAGSRNILGYQKHDWFNSKLDHLFSSCKSEVEIVSGRARGADRMGERYASENGLKVHLFPADWEGLGKKAGYIRNGEMAEFSDALVAFWDGKSRGTKHMIDLARKHGLKVRVIQY
jgi:hypothetical protein